MAISPKQAARHYQENEQRAQRAQRLYETLRDDVRGRIERARSALMNAELELARAYLPRLDQFNIGATERLTGFRGFSRRDPLRALAHEQHTLERTIKRIENDPRFVERERLVGSIGTLTRAHQEAASMLEPFARECRRFEDLEGFVELYLLGYDTPQFSEHWWQPSYWKHWKRGDAICEALQMDDFGDDVLPAYREVEEQRSYWRQKTEQAMTAIQAVHDLVQTRDESIARIPQLPALYLQQAQRLLAQYLDGTDLQLLEQWSRSGTEPDRAIVMNLRKVAGIKAKIAIFEDLLGRGLEALLGDLKKRQKKYRRKSVKFQRPKYYGARLSEREIDTKFVNKFKKLEAQREKLGKLVQRIDEYDDYQRFDLANDPDLWWFEMSGGKRPPRIFGQARRSYDRDPSRRPIYDTFEDEGARVAVAAEFIQAEPDETYLS